MEWLHSRVFSIVVFRNESVNRRDARNFPNLFLKNRLVDERKWIHDNFKDNYFRNSRVLFLRFESLRNREKFRINFWKKFFLDEIKLNIEKFIPFPCSMLFQDGIIKSLEQLSYTTNNHMNEKKYLNLSSYLIFIPISFQERKPWARQHFEREVCIQTKCIEIPWREPKPYREFILKRNGRIRGTIRSIWSAGSIYTLDRKVQGIEWRTRRSTRTLLSQNSQSTFFHSVAWRHSRLY